MRPRAASPAAADATGRTAASSSKACAGFGFETLLPDRLQAPIIVTFHMPADPKFAFETFYDGLSERGFVIYPGKLTVADSFRIGCIGRLGATEMQAALAAVEAVMGEMGVASGSPRKRAAGA